MCGYDPGNLDDSDINRRVWKDNGEVMFTTYFQDRADVSVFHIDLQEAIAENVYYRIRRIDYRAGYNMYFDNSTVVIFNSTKGTFSQTTLNNSQEHYELFVHDSVAEFVSIVMQNSGPQEIGNITIGIEVISPPWVDVVGISVGTVVGFLVCVVCCCCCLPFMVLILWKCIAKHLPKSRNTGPLVRRV